MYVKSVEDVNSRKWKMWIENDTGLLESLKQISGKLIPSTHVKYMQFFEPDE